MPDFTPEPATVDNWRDHTRTDGPSCQGCGHPLWAPQSVVGKLCAGCAADPVVYYDGPPHLVVTDPEHARIGT